MLLIVKPFLDVQDTRISRGDGGSVFVLVKDVSFPSNLPPSTTAIVPIADTPQGSDLPASTTAIVPIADTPQQSGVAGTSSAPAPYLSVSSLVHDSLWNKQVSFCEPAASQALTMVYIPCKQDGKPDTAGTVAAILGLPYGKSIPDVVYQILGFR